MIRPPAFAVAVLCAWPAGPLSAQEMVGYVASLEGDGASLLRSDAPSRRLLLGENVLAGDTIVAPRQTRVRVDTVVGPVDPCVPLPPSGDCRRRFVSAGQSRAPADVASRLAAMVTWFAAPSRNFVTRSDDPPRFRIGAGVPQTVLAGRRRLWIAWSDGTPPFKVTLKAQGSLVAQTEASGRDVLLPLASLSEGSLTIAVTDQTGRRAVLAASVRLSGPVRPKMAVHAVGPDHRLILEAAELATIDRGRWVLEAIQSLDDATARAPVAELLRRALVAGDRL